MLTLSGVAAEEVSADSSAGNGGSAAEPTYTLVYAILGILFVSVLFYASRIRNND